ncbi:hypothetical protein ACFVVM_32800 [Nocardia sp. NPDC058176]|uniref:hypothetical protein n=1 Tax=Nocardia sp. NPDC058176 TaxID=3346368 RepID=UPI0036D86739
MINTVGICSVIGYGLLVWLSHDGPTRLYAGIAAVRAKDPAVRQAAYLVLAETRYLRGREPGTADPSWVSMARLPWLGRRTASPRNDDPAST